jgi:methionyl-tRNA synthetase
MTKFYFTTPLYYPNARLHAGHAYTTLVCDAFARYKRLCGYDVAFLTGTDEHGEKLERAANEAGVSPPAFVADKRAEIQKLWKLLDISYTHFIYTDRPDHTVSVQRMLLAAQRAGYIYKGHYEGRYCVFDELYISEGSEPAKCPICGRPGELISEHNYFFKLSAFQDRLLELYEKHPEFVKPDFRRNEVKSFVKSGLRDISVSRKRIKWGVPWPDDPEQVFYVWYDALTGYLTGIGFGEAEGGSAEFRKYWPADFHMVGKDIIRFHAVYWPAFLMAAGLPLPRSIVAHGWLLVEGDKMSKSKGNAVYPEPLATLFESETKGVVAGSDVLRYYVLRDIPFGQDGSISYEGLLQRYNSDLANDLGNLANRTITMIGRYCGGVLLDHKPGWTGREEQIEAQAKSLIQEYPSFYDGYDFWRALDRAWDFVGEVNKYLVVTQPWTLAQNSDASARARLTSILYTSAESLRILSVLLCPVIPRSAERLWRQLGIDGEVTDQRLDQLQWGGLQGGTKVGEPQIIFPRLDKAAALAKLLKLQATEQPIQPKEEPVKVLSENKPAEPAGAPPCGAEQQTRPQQPAPPQGPQGKDQAAQPEAPQPISIDDFAKVEMRVGEVLSAEPIPGAKKLLKLMVDIGSEVRQVCAGIAEYYRPEQLAGMKVIVVTNLQPRKLRGVESNGMIVAASVGEDGKPVLATFNEDVPKGARLK